MIDRYRCGVFIGAFWHFPSSVGDHATDEMGVFGGDLAVGAVGNQDGALFIGDRTFRVTLGEVGAAAAALWLADAVCAGTYTYVHAHAAIFTFVGVLQAFHRQGASGDIGGVGSDDGAAQGQLVAGAVQVANIDLRVDVLGSVAVAARFVVAGIGIPAARSTGADANADVARVLLKAVRLSVGGSVEEGMGAPASCYRPGGGCGDVGRGGRAVDGCEGHGQPSQRARRGGVGGVCQLAVSAAYGAGFGGMKEAVKRVGLDGNAS